MADYALALDQSDSLNARATKVLDDIHSAGDSYLLLDFMAEEARFRGLSSGMPTQDQCAGPTRHSGKVKRLYQRNEIEFVHGEIEDLYPEVDLSKAIRLPWGLLAPSQSLQIGKRSGDARTRKSDATMWNLKKKPHAGTVQQAQWLGKRNATTP